MITSSRDIFDLTAKQIVTRKVNGSKHFEVKIPTENPIKVCTFFSREMRTGTHFRRFLDPGSLSMKS